MQKTGFISIRINQDDTHYMTNVTSLTVSNYGATDMQIVINGVARLVPAFNPTIGVPFGSFNLPGDGTACDVTMELKFDTGIGNAILDYRKTTKQETC